MSLQDKNILLVNLGNNVVTVKFGSGNGHFYHISVIDLPFHTIPFVSCFISVIENTKK